MPSRFGQLNKGAFPKKDPCWPPPQLLVGVGTMQEQSFSDYLKSVSVTMDQSQLDASRDYSLYLASLLRKYGWYEAASLLERLVFSLYR